MFPGSRSIIFGPDPRLTLLPHLAQHMHMRKVMDPDTDMDTVRMVITLNRQCISNMGIRLVGGGSFGAGQSLSSALTLSPMSLCQLSLALSVSIRSILTLAAWATELTTTRRCSPIRCAYSRPICEPPLCPDFSILASAPRLTANQEEWGINLHEVPRLKTSD